MTVWDFPARTVQCHWNLSDSERIILPLGLCETPCVAYLGATSAITESGRPGRRKAIHTWRSRRISSSEAREGAAI